MILDYQTTKSSLICILVATIDIGMGLDCPDIRGIYIDVHQTVMKFIRRNRKSRRDGSPATTFLFYGRLNRHIDEDLKWYCTNTTM